MEIIETEEINLIEEEKRLKRNEKRRLRDATKRLEAQQEAQQEAIEVIEVSIPTPTPSNTPTQTPQKKQRQNKVTLDKTLESNVRMLLTTGFTLASAKLGPQWIISEDETKSISEPLSRIMQRMGLSETANANTDYIMLIASLSIILIPRVLMSLPKKEKKQNGGANTNTAEVKRDNPTPHRRVEPKSNVNNAYTQLIAQIE